ncbi:MAG: translation initiation factor IF-2 [Akkermansiaceae bacterium]|jgi:translation initiation factor IF-2|tara:strand:+ start:107 stop:2218 length:2112 start_codon:yes stop_codon:yes gene_type:complete
MADDKDNKDSKKDEILDLLSENPKPSRRERQRQDASKVQTVDDQKKAALDLGIEDDKPKKSAVRKTENSGKDILPSISKRLVEKHDPEFAKPVIPMAVEEVVPDEDEGSVDGNVISIKPPIIVSDLAEKMGKLAFEIMADLIKLEVFVAPTQAIEPDIAEKVCEAHGFVFEREKREKGGGVHKEEEIFVEPEAVEEEPEEQLAYRAPIITFMGHVDHGKTSLLDFIRKSRVASGEAGGITQHVGAYSVQHGERRITFLDTPGHAIFSKMRSRGADVTDIVVVVVAADDGIMPQTVEAIQHAKAAGKTIIVAINKIDLPAADPMRVMTQLMEHELVPSEMGGETECIKVSAQTGEGIDALLELMALQAEVLELRANPKANVRASVIEASIKAGRGATATVIVESGTLKKGQPFICGPFAGKIKDLFNDQGEPVKEAGPSTPVEVLGFSELPNVGDSLVGMDSERAAKKLSEERMDERRKERLVQPKKSRLEDMLQAVSGGGKAQLKLILRTDVQGTAEAIKNAIVEIESDKVEASFLIAGAGAINESDVLMASSADAIILGFNVKVDGKAVKAAKAEGVQVKLYSIVYELIDQVKESMLGMLDPEIRETVIGRASVKQVFKVNGGRAAGCVIKSGKVSRKAHARVLRGKQPVFDGKMSTLRRHTDEVDEVKQGIECGIRLGSFNDYEDGDVIECYTLDKVDQTL